MPATVGDQGGLKACLLLYMGGLVGPHEHCSRAVARHDYKPVTCATVRPRKWLRPASVTQKHHGPNHISRVRPPAEYPKRADSVPACFPMQTCVPAFVLMNMCAALPLSSPVEYQRWSARISR